ncbi:PucR family transcriptional regulator [Corynebacterium sp. USCH3]|uniref:PucR family transcriptional regulator n=1 Tax=Corynebacterium sp. USCH3 TaxID=3024840 RepID=UPI0030AC3367
MLIVDLIADPSLNLELATPSSDDELHRPVRTVVTAEQLDPTAYLEPDTLLLTTGMAMNFEDGRIWEAYVERLVTARVPALAFGIGQPHARVPEGLIAAARSFGLPILTVAADMPFLHLQHSVNQAIAGERYWESRQAWDIATACTRSASRNEGVDRLVELIGQKAGTTVTVYDETGFVVAGGRGEKVPDGGAGQLSIPLSISGETTWTLVVPAEAGREMRVLLTPAAAILGMALTRQFEELGSAGVTRTAEMIQHPDADLMPFVVSELLEAGVDPTRGTRGVRIASRSGIRRSVLAHRVESALSSGERSALLVTVGGFLLMVLPDDGRGEVWPTPEALAPCVDPAAGDSVLVGPRCETPEDLVLSLRIQVGRETTPGVAIQGVPDLGDVVGLLPEVFRSALVTAVLGPLLDSSDRRRAFATLEALLYADTQTRAAEVMGVHRNTLLANRRRVERKLGVDLTDSGDRALCVTALRLLWPSGTERV